MSAYCNETGLYVFLRDLARVDISEHSSDTVLLASESSLRTIQSCGVVLKFRFG